MSKPSSRTPSVTRTNRTRSEIQIDKPLLLEEVKRKLTKEPKKINKQENMDTQQIQQQVASFVPEFSGDEGDSTKVAGALNKFTGTANIIYNKLKSEEEKEYFGEIIKFRLTGSAFNTIDRQQVKEYTKIRTILENIYEPTISLNELENTSTNIKQQYGESIRKYGYRLTEAVEQYKAGFRTKYKMAKLEANHEKHVDTKSLETFKKGLINNVLKEKMATSTAKNIEEIIGETEKVEAMLSMVTTEQKPTNTQQQSDPSQQILELMKQIQQSTQSTQKFQRNLNPVTCNYCQRPNHTWDACRTRMAAERNTQINQNSYNSPRSTNHNNRPRVTNNPNWNNFRTLTPQTNFAPRMYPNNNNGRYQNNFAQHRQQQQINPTQPMQPQQRNNYEPKYCSHCKTTSSHTYEECRNKLRSQNQYNNTNDHQSQPQSRYEQPRYQQPQYQTNYYQQRNQQQQSQPTNGDKLANELQNLRINQVVPNQDDRLQYETSQQNQGNSTGSSQQ